MATLAQMLDRVRLRLGDPKPQRPSDPQLLLALNTQVQSYINKLNLSGRPWAVDEYLLTVSPGTEDYLITALNFGKPLQVRTYYPTNPAHIERTVDFFELQDLNFDWNLPLNFGNTYYNLDGSPHTAVRMAFFRKLGLDDAYVRVLPIPQQAASYKVLYQIGNYVDVAGLGDIPVLPQHHALIEVRTAIDVLPLSEWEMEMDSSRRQELSDTLANTEKHLAAEFETYAKTITVSNRLTERAVWAME